MENEEIIYVNVIQEFDTGDFYVSVHKTEKGAEASWEKTKEISHKLNTTVSLLTCKTILRG